ncbi:MAG: PAS domain S-box protein [Chloroflexi bacterium]|nr:PAS domain S-box protein [Chloroflexota bacterium]
MEKTRILVVEDEEIVAADLRSTLHKSGYDVIASVSSGEEAINQVTTYPPDLILMDIILKGKMDGVEAAEQIHTNYNIPVIYLTAYSDETALRRAKITTPYAYILKPFDDRELNIAIELALYKSQIDSKLRKSEAKFAKTFQSSPIASLISTLEESLILDVNDKAIELFEYTREEMIGHTSLALNFWLDPETRSPLIALLRTQGYARDVEISFRSKSGKIHELLASYELIELDGKTQVLSMLHDVTALKQADQIQTLLASIVESSDDAIIGKTLEGIIISWNQAATRIYGYSAEEAIGRPVSILESPTRADEITKILEKIKQGEQVSHFETVRRRKDGSEIDVSLTISPLKDKAGTIIGASAIARDITERKQGEQALKEAHQRLNDVLESIQDSFYVLNSAECFTYVNHKAAELWGKRPEDLIGKSIWEVFPQTVGLNPYHNLRRSIQKAISEQTPVGFETYSVLLNYWVEVLVYPYDSGVSVYYHNITERKQMEEALRQSEARFQAFMDNSPAAGWIMDNEGKIIYLSQPYGRLTGIDIEKAIGKSTVELYPTEISEGLMATVRQVDETGQTIEVVEAFPRPDGTTGFALSYKFPLPDSDQHLIGGVSVDITARVRAEEALRQSEEMYRLLARNLPDSSILIFDREMRYLIAEGGALVKNGFSREMMEGKTLQEILPPEEVVRLLPYYQAALAGLENTFESYYDNQVYLVRIVPIRNEQGRITAGMLFSEDITDLKKAEQILAEEKEQLSVTLRSIGDGVITTNLHGEVTLLNQVAEELLGWSQAEAMGKPLSDIFHIIDQETRQTQINPIAETLNTGRIVLLQEHTLLVNRDGSELVISDSCAPIRDQLSKINGAVLVFRDITNQQRMEKELQNASKLEAIGLLAGGIAHDFNNLLAGIIGFLDLTKIQLGDRNKLNLEEIEGFVEEANNAALRAKSLTLQLLTFAKGGTPIKKTAQLDQFIRDSASFVLHGSEVESQFELAKDLWLVEADTDQMGQVIQNLVLNAAQAMPEGGFIKITGQNVELTEGTVSALTPGKYVLLSIQDTGKGISPENLAKIFDPYFTTKPQGNGLGLAVCFSIVKKHNGYIQVESEVGKGTTFYIYLPASKNLLETQTPAPVAKTLPVISPATRSIKLLIMDDEANLRELLKRTLQKFGHRVEIAKDGGEVLQLYQAALEQGQPFDVVLLDLTIPGGMGGKQTIVKLLELDPQVKAIVCSGYSSDPIMSNYQEYGFKEALLKPYRLQELSNVLERITGGSTHFRNGAPSTEIQPHF